MAREATETLKAGGVLFNKYTLGRLLGRGTFAKVYEARPKSDPTTIVAIKAIDKSHVSDPAAAARVLREVSIMRLLRHPGVVALHEVMATKSKIYLVVEFAPGGDLRSLLARRGALTEPAAFKCFHQLASALGFCHARGVSHRDIKPHNILLDAEGNLKVTDFGLSALPENARDDGMLQTACGTPAFTAPEVVRRKGYDGKKADAWSCGVMLFVLLAGYLPYDDTNLVAMYKKVMKREVVYPAWVKPQSRRLIHRLMDPNPTTRMTIQEVLELRWFKKYHQNYSQSLTSKNSIIGDHDPKVFGINAFDIISMSSGLDLSGLLEETKIPAGSSTTRFISTQPLGKVVERAEEVGKMMGCDVKRGKWGDVIFLKSGEEFASVVVVTVAESMVMGGLKVGIEGFSCWDNLKGGFQDIVLAWQTNST